jgi:hypothetical protein
VANPDSFITSPRASSIASTPTTPVARSHLTHHAPDFGISFYDSVAFEKGDVWRRRHRRPASAVTGRLRAGGPNPEK